MNGALLVDGFRHLVWATLALIDACLELSPDDLDTNVPGTFGSIIDTMRHLVDADVSYQWVLSGKRTPRIDSDNLSLGELRSTMEAVGSEWTRLLAGDLDPAGIVTRDRDDGSQSRAPLTIRLAQAVHHGTDHRSQICTALTSLGIEPPEIDVWAFAANEGRLEEVPAPA